MEKPDFNRISWVLDYFTEKELEKVDFCFNDIEDIAYQNMAEWNDQIIDLMIQWDKIAEEKNPNPQYSLLEILLSENHMTDLLSDFKLLAYIFTEWMEGKEDNESIRNKKNKEFELLNSLKILLTEKDITLKILRKHNSNDQIKSPELIEVIKQSLIEYFKKNDNEYKFMYLNEFLFRGLIEIPKFDETDSENYFESRIQKYKRQNIKRGAVVKHSDTINKMVQKLHLYLESFTRLKAKPNSVYSNEQVRFIFRFLEIFNLIEKPSKGSNEADYIANNFLIKNRKKKPPLG